MSKVFVPHDYQYEIIDFILKTQRCGVLAGMGTGKSASTLAALEHLSLVEDVYPALVLAPLRVAKATWPDEGKKWQFSEHLRIVPIVGTEKERLAALRKDAEIFTCNYEQIDWLTKTLGDKWPFKTVVADELTRLKGFRSRQGSKRAKALSTVAHTYVNRFIGLTGTPTPNGIKDLWGQIHFLDRGERLGRSYSAFEARWFTKGYDGFSVTPLPHAQREIEGRIKDVCLTVTGLPVDEPINNVIEVTLPREAMSIYREMEKEMFIELEGSEIVAVNAAARTNKCLQLANGAVYLDPDEDEIDKPGRQWREVHDVKIDALRSVIEEAAGAPILVAYNFVSDLARLKKAFPSARVLDANPKTIHDWNAGKIQLLLAHPLSAGHGISLQDGGNILVFFGLDWNLESHMQIIERIGPMRQKQSGYDRPVFIHYIVTKGTVDALVLERLASKKSVQEILLTALRRSKGASPSEPGSPSP